MSSFINSRKIAKWRCTNLWRKVR